MLRNIIIFTRKKGCGLFFDLYSWRNFLDAREMIKILSHDSAEGVWKMLSLIWQSHLWFRKIVVRRSAHFACMELEVNHWQEEVHCQKSRWRTQSMNNGSHQNEAQTRNKRSFRSAKFSLKDIHCHVTGSIHLSQIHIHFFSKRNWLDGV